READRSMVEFSMFHGKERRTEWSGFNSVMGFDVPLSEVTGLAASEIAASAANVQFALVRPAGMMRFEGRFADGNGAGSFKFSQNEAFIREMDSLGLKDFTDDDLLVLAAHNFAPPTVRD